MSFLAGGNIFGRFRRSTRRATRQNVRSDALRNVSRSVARCIGIIVLLVLCYCLVPLQGAHWWLGALIGATALAGILPIAIYRFRAVVSSSRPLLDAVEALVLLLTLLILSFAAVFFAMNHDHNQFNGLDTRVDAVYFTVATLSTVGYGDITAISQRARFAVTIEILFNLAFVGLSVRVFTSAARGQIRDRFGNGRPDAGAPPDTGGGAAPS